MVQQISDAELEIMKIVWGNPEDVTLFPYIMDGLAARGKPCQKNTLIVLLSRLMNKGFLSAKKIGRRNEYTTLVSEAEYQTAQTKNFLDKIYEGSAKGLVSNLIMGDLLTDGEYEDLKKLLEKGKEKHSSERQKQLDKLGMIWVKPDPWEVRYDFAKAYYEEHGNLNIPSKYRADGIWLAKWVNEQKQVFNGKRKGKTLRVDQVRRLEAIGMEWGLQKKVGMKIDQNQETVQKSIA